MSWLDLVQWFNRHRLAVTVISACMIASQRGGSATRQREAESSSATLPGDVGSSRSSLCSHLCAALSGRFKHSRGRQELSISLAMRLVVCNREQRLFFA